jgi:hypothetical protein
MKSGTGNAHLRFDLRSQTSATVPRPRNQSKQQVATTSGLVSTNGQLSERIPRKRPVMDKLVEHVLRLLPVG